MNRDVQRFAWANRHGFGFRLWVIEVQVYGYKPEWCRFSYAVAMEDKFWSDLTKREAEEIFRQVKLPFGESVALSRTHKRTGVTTLLDTRYQPDEANARTGPDA